MDALTCPKCGNPWRSFERSGIVVDQCTGCRGVFLDRGELERLVESEAGYAEGRSLARADELGFGEPYRERYPPRSSRGRDWDDDDDHSPFGRGRRRHRERDGFLEDLFGGDD
jgi:hypothetical protein